MAEPESEVVIGDETVADEEMETENVENDGAEENGGLENIEPAVADRTAFSDYLRSPIVELVLGGPGGITSLYAHQALITKSPTLAKICEQFIDPAIPRRIELPDEDLDATSSVIEYLYKDDYFPSVSNRTNLEEDPTIPSPDDGGVGLLRHARVYTLAKRWELPELQTLAHRKIHLTPSTAKGEIAYARFVYQHTTPDDENVRKPVANFWASRSYVLRHEAEQEFKQMCLEFPQFGFDVLSLVLDTQEKNSAKSGPGGVPGRKRQRVL